MGVAGSGRVSTAERWSRDADGALGSRGAGAGRSIGHHGNGAEGVRERLHQLGRRRVRGETSSVLDRLGEDGRGLGTVELDDVRPRNAQVLNDHGSGAKRAATDAAPHVATLSTPRPPAAPRSQDRPADSPRHAASPPPRAPARPRRRAGPGRVHCGPTPSLARPRRPPGTRPGHSWPNQRSARKRPLRRGCPPAPGRRDRSRWPSPVGPRHPRGRAGQPRSRPDRRVRPGSRPDRPRRKRRTRRGR